MNTIESLKSVCNVKGWDGYDAEVITDKVYANAEILKEYMPESWKLFPTGRNSVQWEYQFESDDTEQDSFYGELEVFENKAVYFYFHRDPLSKKITEEKETVLSIENMKDFLDHSNFKYLW